MFTMPEHIQPNWMYEHRISQFSFKKQQHNDEKKIMCTRVSMLTRKSARDIATMYVSTQPRQLWFICCLHCIPSDHIAFTHRENSDSGFFLFERISVIKLVHWNHGNAIAFILVLRMITLRISHSMHSIWTDLVWAVERRQKRQTTSDPTQNKYCCVACNSSYWMRILVVRARARVPSIISWSSKMLPIT